ncbi:MAG: POTRA domain-containing protein, partial [Elusimicrobiota bacterium]
MAKKLKTAAAAAVLAGTVGRARAEPVAGLSVGSVTVLASPIFDTSLPAESAWLFRTANALHVDTRKGVILRELLLREGDPYDPALVAESERNLRRFGFLRGVRIEASAPQEGRVDLTVRTRDAWTTEPQVNFTRSGGRNSWNAGLVERNLAGYGKGVSAFYDRGLERIHRTFGYRDPQFLGRRLD